MAYDQGLNAIEFRNLLLRLIRSYSTFAAIHDLPRRTACCFLPHPRVHSLHEQQAASVTAGHNPGHGTKGDIKDCESRLGASISPRLPTLDWSTETTDFAILAFVGPSLVHHHVARPMESLESQVHVSLSLDSEVDSHMEWQIRSPSWRGDIQLGVTPDFGSFRSSQNDPPFWDPSLAPPCVVSWRPHISLPRGSPDPTFKSCTQLWVPGPASYPVSHWPCSGRAGHAWE